jgi:hypothetical protein
MWKNTVKLGRVQLTIRRIRIACWLPKAANTHSEYVIFTAFARQQWLHESASMLPHTYIACPDHNCECSLRGTKRTYTYFLIYS